jgi:hypothetical protein
MKKKKNLRKDAKIQRTRCGKQERAEITFLCISIHLQEKKLEKLKLYFPIQNMK